MNFYGYLADLSQLRAMRNANPLLVVDEDARNRAVLSRRLARRGYAVESAESGQSALEKLQAAKSDVILVDPSMEGLGGVDLLRLLQATRSSSDLPVIMVTGADQVESVVDALKERTSANAAHWDWDLVTNRLVFDSGCAEILGYHASEIGSHPDEWLGRIHAYDATRVRAEIRAHLDGRTAELESEHRLRRKDGKYVWVRCRAEAIRSSTRAIRLAGTFTDIDRLKLTDPLTGLANRHHFLDQVSSALNAYHSGAGGAFSVLFLDLDGFAAVNESFSRETADRLLIEVSKRLKCALTEPNLGIAQATLARFGGDEFAILLDDVTTDTRLQAIAAAIRERIAAIEVENNRIMMTASIGAVVAGAERRSAEEILRDADLAMFRAKESGKNQCQIFESLPSPARMTLAADLRRAIERGEFTAFYQPIVRLATHEILGFEALLRWRHPQRGMVLPGEFISLAEQTGLIVQLGEWILREASRQLGEWLKMYPQAPLSMNVNLSANQLSHPRLLPHIADVLHETKIPPPSLHLEITETSLMRDVELSRKTLRGLRELGVGVKLDDFGTGYSSLNYLQYFHFDGLKIDRCFVSGLGDDETREIVKTILNLARSLRMGVVAEGIETGAQLSELIGLGCQTGQGFYFSRPVDVPGVERLLSSGFNTLPESRPA